VQLAFRRAAGGFFFSSPPTPAQCWAAQAEARWLMAECIGLRLPLDSPPEVVLLAERKETPGASPPLLAYEDYREAFARAYG